MSDIAYILICSSTEPDAMREPIYLSIPETCIGRPETGETMPFIDLKELFVSRKHAIIRIRENAYVLQNWEGRFDIGLYTTVLKQGDSHTLRHGDIFRIPDRTDHFKCIFLIKDITQVLPLHHDSKENQFYVFSDTLNLTPKEYTILAYLYERHGIICSYEDIIAAVWPEEVQIKNHPSRRNDLDVHLSSLRKKIRAASGGFTFIRTVAKLGLQLRVM